MMRILLCCEGSGDQGRKEFVDGDYDMQNFAGHDT
jgi:hypothetical protein